MKKDNDTKKKILTVVIGVLLMFLVALVLSYAWFSTILNGNDQVVKVGELELVLNETSEGISLDKAIGLSDNAGMNLTPSTFELKNNGNKAVDYTIYLDDNTISDTDTRIDDKYLKYNLVKNDVSSGATLLTKIGANPNRILDSGTIDGGETNTYSLNLWITNDVDGNYSGQVFSGKLRVEVSQERKTVAEVLLADSANNINTDDPKQTFITGSNPNNYIWYSGKLWRAVSIDTSDNSVKLVTQEVISAIPYDNDSSAFEGSYMEMWLNDTTVDGFLGNLRNPEKFIKMNSKWNASMMSDTSKPPSEEEGGTIVEDAVGLLNVYEYDMIGNSTSYLNNGLYWWAITPAEFFTNIYGVQENILKVDVTSAAYGIRPSVNLKPKIKVISGNGTGDNPYRLMGDNDTNLEGTKLNTRYSGEYLKFGTDENNLYRIVSHETEGLTKITSTELLRENGTLKTISFGDTAYYSSTNTIGSFLNGGYLTNYVGETYSNMIEEDTTWYLGKVALGEGYYLAKYTDENLDKMISNITQAKVGLLRLGELMVTPSSNVYWTITPRSNSGWYILINEMRPEGYMIYRDKVNFSNIKPALNLKENIIITGGDGTKENPFELSNGQF